MQPSNQRSRGRTGVTQTTILALVLLGAIVALLMHFHAFRNRVHNLTLHGQQASSDPATQRARILEQITQFNAQADSTDLIHVGGASSPAVTSVIDTAIAVAGDMTTFCPGEKEPTDKRFKMRTKLEVEAENPELAAALKAHHIDNEIMLALANGIMICQNTSNCWWKGGNILQTFIGILEYNNVTNHLIGVMDDETMLYLKKQNDDPKNKFKVNFFKVNIPVPKSQLKSHPANRVSTIKYTLLMEIIQMGYNTLITDMDLVYMKNPFHHLHRDSDIEIQTDGFNDQAYGVVGSVHDPSMGWGGGGLYITLFTTNVGCMYVNANQRTFTLMKQVHERLNAEPGWDQQVFNDFLLKPSHGNFVNSGSSLRVMEYMKWTNSKIFFKSRRAEFIPGATSTAAEPILVHFNYHPDKHTRMLCIVDRYHKGIVDACDKFPSGSDPV